MNDSFTFYYDGQKLLFPKFPLGEIRDDSKNVRLLKFIDWYGCVEEGHIYVPNEYLPILKSRNEHQYGCGIILSDNVELWYQGYVVFSYIPGIGNCFDIRKLDLEQTDLIHHDWR